MSRGSRGANTPGGDSRYGAAGVVEVSTAAKRGFIRLPLLGRCGVCQQLTLQRFVLNVWGGGLIISFCPDCDTGHCPRCRAHPTSAGARMCLGCGQSLDPRNGTTFHDERQTRR